MFLPERCVLVGEDSGCFLAEVTAALTFFVQYIIALSMRCVEDYANRKIRQRSHLKKESYKKRSCMEVNIVYGRYSQSIHWRMNSTLKHCDNVEFAYIVHRTGPFPAS